MQDTSAAPEARPTQQSAVNRLLVAILRSPVHALASGSTAVLVYRGRRTALTRELPVRYAQADGGYVVLVGRPEQKRWWRNFTTPWPLTVVARGRAVAVEGTLVSGDSEEGLRLAGAYFARFPGRLRRARRQTRRDVLPSTDQEILATAAHDLRILRARRLR